MNGNKFATALDLKQNALNIADFTQHVHTFFGVTN